MPPIIVIAASAGAFGPLRNIVRALPPKCAISVFVVMHIGPYASILPELLGRPDGPSITFARNGDLIESGHVYVAPPDHHMVLERHHVRLNQGPKIHYTRPAADPLFVSAARVHGRRVVGIVLSGGDGDGAEGLRMIKEHHGVTLVQNPKEATVPSMPLTAIAADGPDVLLISEIIKRVTSLCIADLSGA